MSPPVEQAARAAGRRRERTMLLEGRASMSGILPGGTAPPGARRGCVARVEEREGGEHEGVADLPLRDHGGDASERHDDRFQVLPLVGLDAADASAAEREEGVE